MSFGFGFGFTKITTAIRAAFPPAFSPASLFAQGEPGVWYDPSDFSTMFQDSAGTVPVTAVEQPVGRILDKSGRGFHATQATATSRPVLRQDGSGKHYLYFDGVDDFLVTPTITPGIDKVQVFAGVRSLTALNAILLDMQYGLILRMQSPSGNGGKNFAFTSKSVEALSANAYPRPTTRILSGIGDIAADTAVLRVDGMPVAQNATDQGTGNYGQHSIEVGRPTAIQTALFNGHLYSLIVRFGSNLPIETIEQVEAWINGKTGAY